jgi:hypothetical protein
MSGRSVLGLVVAGLGAALVWAVVRPAGEGAAGGTEGSGSARQRTSQHNA